MLQVVKVIDEPKSFNQNFVIDEVIGSVEIVETLGLEVTVRRWNNLAQQGIITISHMYKRQTWTHRQRVRRTDSEENSLDELDIEGDVD